ncbi:MAG: hypothetical protein KDJ14_10880 [Xanthomonadales bacterium]|nr:hypothetical protein [Xanthomonadales bacterium]
MSEALTRFLLAATGSSSQDPTILYAAAYDELRALAARQRGRMPGLPSSDTSLVHEAYLKLHRREHYVDRQHFFATAARAMRQILVDVARAQAAAKRGDGRPDIRLEDASQAIGATTEGAEQVLDVDAALRALGAEDASLADLVELRFFAGLGLDEIAALQQRSERSLKRDWVKARAFLRLHVADYDA